LSRAILLVDHGSRRKEANAVLEAVAERVRQRSPGCIVEVAHMDLATPDIAQGILACVRGGASEIVVHPYFLGPGVHTQRDIPLAVESAAARHPGLRVVISEPLGVHEKLVDVVLERVENAPRD
jgi:sirohydrochlorin ferrochelatase